MWLGALIAPRLACGRFYGLGLGPASGWTGTQAGPIRRLVTRLRHSKSPTAQSASAGDRTSHHEDVEPTVITSGCRHEVSRPTAAGGAGERMSDASGRTDVRREATGPAGTADAAGSRRHAWFRPSRSHQFRRGDSSNSRSRPRPHDAQRRSLAPAAVAAADGPTPVGVADGDAPVGPADGVAAADTSDAAAPAGVATGVAPADTAAGVASAPPHATPPTPADAAPALALAKPNSSRQRGNSCGAARFAYNP